MNDNSDDFQKVYMNLNLEIIQRNCISDMEFGQHRLAGICYLFV